MSVIDRTNMTLTAGFKDVDGVYSPANMYDETGECVAQVSGVPLNGMRKDVEASGYNSQGLAVADRIAACVNACAGIKNPSALPEILATVSLIHATFIVSIEQISAIAKLIKLYEGLGYTCGKSGYIHFRRLAYGRDEQGFCFIANAKSYDEAKAQLDAYVARQQSGFQTLPLLLKLEDGTERELTIEAQLRMMFEEKPA